MKVGKDFCFGGEGKSNYHFHNQPNEKPINLVNSHLSKIKKIKKRYILDGFNYPHTKAHICMCITCKSHSQGLPSTRPLEPEREDREGGDPGYKVDNIHQI